MGKSLFYAGEVPTYELVDQERFDRTVQRAIDLNMYKGVEFHPKNDGDPPPSLREFIARESLGTDFALRFGRTAYCTRLPMSEEMLVKAAAILEVLT